jgi:Tfp pilus assembly protein PilX
MTMTTKLGQARRATDERGVALPMAMITLLLLTSLMIAFAVLAKSEPQIANNQLRVAQARALAESGFERAVWALGNPANAAGIADPMPTSPAAAPYDGTFVGVATTGGFQVTVTSGATASERNLVAVGWTPTSNLADTRTKAHRRIQATVMKFTDLALNAPCALCVRGALQVSGNSNIDARGDTSCGKKYGTYTSNATCIGGSCSDSGSMTIYGAFDTGAAANTPNQPTDYQQNQDPATFDAFTLKPNDLAALRQIAKQRGTYYGPGSPSSMGWSDGSVTFNAGNRMPNGIIFIDNVDATDISQANNATVPPASVSIHGNFPADPSGTFSGWIIVNGTLNISGNIRIDGLVYSLNDISYTGTGTGEIRGLVVSQNTRDTSSTSIDTNTGGNATIEFDCQKARGGGQVPPGWFLEAGTYREVSDP